MLQQFGDKAQLPHPRPLAQRQVNHAHAQRFMGCMAAAEASQNRTAPGQAGQLVIDHFVRLDSAQQTIAVHGDGAHATVDLVMPVREAAVLGQILGLDDLVTAQAPAIDFLQAHDIVGLQQLGDAVEIGQASATGPHMPPAAGNHVPVTGGVDARLNVEAGQPQAPRMSGGHFLG